MTATVEWFCNHCNASCQVRKVGDEASTGYMKTPLDTTPPLGWVEIRSGEHACPECITRGRLPVQSSREDSVVMGDPERAAAFAAVPPASRTNWPSRTSPFTGRDTEDVAGSGGVRDDG